MDGDRRLGRDRGSVDVWPSVSVVIPAHNASAVLPTQLAALAKQDYPGWFEVIIADNGSVDGTARIAGKFDEALRLRVVTARQIRTPAHARNVGARAAVGRLLCFCDADDRCEASWLTAMARATRTADAAGGQLDEAALNSARVQTWRSRLASDGLPNAWYYLDYAVSSNFAIWVSVFEALGGFREDLFSCEDIDLCWRLQSAGGHLVYQPEAVVAYRHRATLSGLFLQQFARAKWAVALVAAHADPTGAPGTGPHLASIRERIAYWDPIRPASFSAGRWIGSLAVEMGILAGRIGALGNYRPTGGRVADHRDLREDPDR
jgi:cellulose synthase/poly-beta-1,6-N-acetylglucosamine synthase-like glycosyltransferase